MAVELSGERLRALVEASVALTSELSLDAVLERLVETAAALTGARYAALGVVGTSSGLLERFVTYGIDAETRAAVGELPQGRGILGVLLHDARPLRLHDLGADPRATGFPPHHPPMRTFLGVPVSLRGVAFGNLYLTEKAGGGDFDREDEELVTLLAAQAAVAVENARLYESATRWSQRLESLIEVGDALTTEIERDRLLDLIVCRLRELLDARLVAIALPSDGDELRLTAVAGERSSEFVGETFALTGSRSGRVLTSRRSERVDALDEGDEVARRMGARAGLWVPLVSGERAIGVLCAFDRLDRPDDRFDEDDQRLAQTFAARAAVAVDMSERVAADTLRRVVEAQEVERRRLARELHDETGQDLTSILLGLRALDRALGDHPARAALADLREHAVATLQGVRRLAVELRPKALDDFGLEPALERLTETWSSLTGIPVDFTAHLEGAVPQGETATALYRIVQEGLTNIAKHAHARRASILLTRNNATVVLVIEDDGRGFDARARSEGFGLDGMRERVKLLGGRLRVESTPEEGTTLVAEVPLL